MPSFRKKMGMLQLGLLAAAAVLLAGGMIVKAKRDALADVPALTAQAPAAGDSDLPQRTFGDHAIPGATPEGEPGVAAGSSDGSDGSAGISVEDHNAMTGNVGSRGEEGTEGTVSHSPVNPPVADGETAPPVMAEADCTPYEAWVGKPVDKAAVEATGKPHRILKPGDAMTMDYNPERINVETDEAGEMVVRVFCG